MTPMPLVPKLEHRSDIEVLRCIAVVAVVLFHFDVPFFSGGYVGVDVFFVISGYLITRMIYPACREGRFSFGIFYTRRIRRLAPAFLATLLLSLSASYFIFFPGDLARNARAITFSLLGLSNYLFWAESGYFDVESTRKIALHTWSLSVEFQYYLLWPALLWALSRMRPPIIVAIVAAIGTASLAACIVILPINAAAGFFWTPFRIWEFCAGSLVFFGQQARPVRQREAESLFLIGLLLVSGCILAYDRQTSFPGLAAVLPVLGTALMILAGESSHTAARLNHLSTRYIGQISYSLYLVHWPVLVLALYAHGGPLTPLQAAGCLALTILLAVVLFHGIERPLRFSGSARRGPVWLNMGCAAAVAVSILPAAYAWQTSGRDAWRLPTSEIVRRLNGYDLLAVEHYVWANFDRLERVQDFSTDKHRILIIGDSQAADVLNMLVEGGYEKEAELVSRRVFTECGLPYLRPGEREDFWKSSGIAASAASGILDQCAKLMEKFILLPALKTADVVVVAFYWRKAVIPYLRQSIQEISDSTPGRVFIVGDKQLKNGSIQLVNELGDFDGVGKYAADSLPQTTVQVNDLLRELYGRRFIDILSVICPASRQCRLVTDDYKPVFSDSTHFTKEGAADVWRQGGDQLFRSPPKSTQ